MIKTIIVDDETLAIDELTYLLNKEDDFEIVASFLNPVKAIEFLIENEVDVCFVDISMPLMNGFEFANTMSKLKTKPLLIFATAYDEYAIQAFDINAIDYILKPISEQRIKTTCQRIRDNLVINDNNKINMISKEIKCIKRIPLWKHDRISIVCIDTILFIEVSESKTYVQTIDDIYVTSDSLQYYQDLLPDAKFFRSHRNFIINIEHINEVIPWFNNTFVVKFKDQEKEIPISRRNIKAFKGLLNL